MVRDASGGDHSFTRDAVDLRLGGGEETLRLRGPGELLLLSSSSTFLMDSQVWHRLSPAAAFHISSCSQPDLCGGVKDHHGIHCQLLQANVSTVCCLRNLIFYLLARKQQCVQKFPEKGLCSLFIHLLLLLYFDSHLHCQLVKKK